MHSCICVQQPLSPIDVLSQVSLNMLPRLCMGQNSYTTPVVQEWITPEMILAVLGPNLKKKKSKMNNQDSDEDDSDDSDDSAVALACVDAMFIS